MKSLRSALTALVLLALAAPALPGCGESHTAGTDAGVSVMFDAPTAPGVDSGGTTTTDTGGTTTIDTGGTTTDPDSGTIDPGTDGGGIVVVDGGTMMGSDAGPPGVSCGTMTCSGTDICCVTGVGGPGGGGMPMFDCTAPADCMGVPVACDGPEDCAAGEACCGSGGPGGGGMAACTAEADCGFIRLCHTEADCETGDMCCMFMMGGAAVGVCSGFGCGFGP